jgi:hypothetical protein
MFDPEFHPSQSRSNQPEGRRLLTEVQPAAPIYQDAPNPQDILTDSSDSVDQDMIQQLLAQVDTSD